MPMEPLLPAGPPDHSRPDEGYQQTADLTYKKQRRREFPAPLLFIGLLINSAV